MDVIEILGAVVMVGAAALVSLVCGALFVWLRNSSGNARYDYVRKIAVDVVTQVEQMYLTGEIDRNQRYQQAKARLQQYFPGLTDAQIKTFIEASVLYMKMAMGVRKEVTPAVLPAPDPALSAAAPRIRK